MDIQAMYINLSLFFRAEYLTLFKPGSASAVGPM
jgi:hypothetical protein